MLYLSNNSTKSMNNDKTSFPNQEPDGFNKKTSTSDSLKKECSCGKINEQVDGCLLCKPQNLSGLMGWLCPACGRGNSPFSTTCPCKPWPLNITYCKTD